MIRAKDRSQEATEGKAARNTGRLQHHLKQKKRIGVT